MNNTDKLQREIKLQHVLVLHDIHILQVAKYDRHVKLYPKVHYGWFQTFPVKKNSFYQAE